MGTKDARKRESPTEENDRDEQVDGPAVAAQILNRMNTSTKDRLVAKIRMSEPVLATKIEQNLFNFDDIADVTPQGLQVLVKSVDHDDIVLSLKIASPGAKSALLDNMSERKRKMVEDDFISLRPTRLIEVEEAQRRIMLKLDELRKAGLVRTGGGRMFGCDDRRNLGMNLSLYLEKAFHVLISQDGAV